MNIIETYRRTRDLHKTAQLFGIDTSSVGAMIPFHVKQEVREERVADAKNYIPLKDYQLFCISELYERGTMLKDLAVVFQVPLHHLIESLKNFQAGVRMPKPPNFMHEPELVGYDVPNFRSLPKTTDEKAVLYMSNKF